MSLSTGTEAHRPINDRIELALLPRFFEPKKHAYRDITVCHLNKRISRSYYSHKAWNHAPIRYNTYSSGAHRTDYMMHCHHCSTDVSELISNSTVPTILDHLDSRNRGNYYITVKAGARACAVMDVVELKVQR